MAASTKELQSKAIERLMTTLREIGGEIHGDDTIARHASPRIVLPEEMEYETAVSVIQKKQRDEEQAYEISRSYNYRPYDGARAVAAVLKDHFGWTVGMPVKTLFGTNPPQLIDIDVDVDKREQIPWGRLQLVHFRDGYIDLGAERHKDFGLIFKVSAMVRRKYRGEIEGVFKLIEEYLRADSIYRGKVITASETPEFIDVSQIDFDDVVYTQQVMEDLETFVWANIDYPQKLRDMGQLGKRVTIVYGTYGVGKTLAAYLTGKRCLMQRTKVNGEYVTCIICRPGIDNWQYAMQIAGLYGRAVIIIEDADLLVDPHNALNISAMLEQFDGLVTKGRDITLVMTTNHIDKIHKGMLRPGRIDGVIEIGFMDEDGVERLAKRVLGDLLEDDINWHTVFVAMDGYTPAYVREVLDRSLRRNIVRNRGELSKISEHDLVGAANNLRPQLALMEGAPEAKERSGIDGALRAIVDSAVNEAVEEQVNGAIVRRVSNGEDFAHIVTV
ncbi:MAG TPA: AAA family ATPase [Actinomycetes bacterium]|nr:AAA family ATPase [Actinomycetes bacterium]